MRLLLRSYWLALVAMFVSISACGGNTAPVAPKTSESAVSLAYVGPRVGLVGTVPTDYKAPPRLYMTNDFHHYTIVTPAGAADTSSTAFSQAFFLNQQDGWVTTFNVGNDQVSIWRTTDGGRSWNPVQGTGHSANAGSASLLQFLTPSEGYLDTLEPTGPGATLSHTSDGGQSWHEVATSLDRGQNSLPIGRVLFLDSLHEVVPLRVEV